MQTELTNQPKASPQPGDVRYSGENENSRSRLSEYEIISEDIADLSLYKEENTRLQAELAKFLAAGACSPIGAAPDTIKPVPAEPVVQTAPGSGRGAC